MAVEALAAAGLPARPRPRAARRAATPSSACCATRVDTAVRHAGGRSCSCSSARPAWARPASPRRLAADAACRARRARARGPLRPLRRGQRVVAGRRRAPPRLRHQRRATPADVAPRARPASRCATRSATRRHRRRGRAGHQRPPLPHGLRRPARRTSTPTRAREEVTAVARRLRRGGARASGRSSSCCPTCTGPTTSCSSWSTRCSSALASQPFVVLATARHALLERWRPRPGATTRVVPHARPARPRGHRRAARRAGRAASCPPTCRQVLLDRSGGNPFFLEELVALLGEAGMVGGPGRGLVGAAELPDTLRGPRRGPPRRPHRRRAARARRRAPSSAAAARPTRCGSWRPRPTASSDVDAVLDRWWPRSSSSSTDGQVVVPVRPRARGRPTARSPRPTGPGATPASRVDRAPRAPTTRRDVDRIAHHYALAARAGRRARRRRGPGVADGLAERALHWLEQGGRRKPRPASCTSSPPSSARRRSSSATRSGTAPRHALPAGPGPRVDAPARARRRARPTSTSAMQDAAASGDPAARAQVLLVPRRRRAEGRRPRGVAGDAASEAIDAFRALGDAPRHGRGPPRPRA